ncbi:hypothetical protein ZEAMMB73_Zm00001d025785 [Zea mays]|uniref:Uncharacterized protein n=1 Tax=Zea mays TaxID=4577 RepID=A0A1D6J9J1_MAIZE|nr:hypothetical protein ZEAMMB73_Zm00001d025785 [Zea mays]
MGELVLRSMHQHLLQEPKVAGVQCRLGWGWWGRPGDGSHTRFRPPPASLRRQGARGGPAGPRIGDGTCSTTTHT